MTLRFTCLLLLAALTVDAQVIPHPEAHAHNDYEHERPLRDALKFGFTTIEADVYVQHGELLVSHNQPAPDAPTLDALYLEPLDSLLAAQHGSVYPGYEGKCLLMIDFKTAAGPTYEALLSTLQKYPHIVRSLQQHGQLQLFISGNRPVTQILEATSPLGALDGRPDDLGKKIPVDKMPVVSEAFAKVCKWRGTGEPSREDTDNVARLAQRAHQENKKLRLWGAPDTPATWAWLLDAGVDIINTDKLQALDAFLRARQ